VTRWQTSRDIFFQLSPCFVRFLCYEKLCSIRNKVTCPHRDKRPVWMLSHTLSIVAFSLEWSIQFIWALHQLLFQKKITTSFLYLACFFLKSHKSFSRIPTLWNRSKLKKTVLNKSCQVRISLHSFKIFPESEVFDIKVRCKSFYQMVLHMEWWVWTATTTDVFFVLPKEKSITLVSSIREC